MTTTIAATADHEVDELKAELNRLTLALQEASAEKIQAAQYGLQVLEEKQQLEVKYADLDTQFETLRAELETAKNVRVV